MGWEKRKESKKWKRIERKIEEETGQERKRGKKGDQAEQRGREKNKY